MFYCLLYPGHCIFWSATLPCAPSPGVWLRTVWSPLSRSATWVTSCWSSAYRMCYVTRPRLVLWLYPQSPTGKENNQDVLTGLVLHYWLRKVAIWFFYFKPHFHWSGTVKVRTAGDAGDPWRGLRFLCSTCRLRATATKTMTSYMCTSCCFVAR